MYVASLNLNTIGGSREKTFISELTDFIIMEKKVFKFITRPINPNLQKLVYETCSSLVENGLQSQ